MDKLITFFALKPLLSNDWAFGRQVVERFLMAERWLSVDEIAAHLAGNPDTIFKWITRKSMPAHKVRRLWNLTVRKLKTLKHRRVMTTTVHIFITTV